MCLSIYLSKEVFDKNLRPKFRFGKIIGPYVVVICGFWANFSTIPAAANSRPSRSASGISVTRVMDASGGGTGIAVGGTEYSRRRAASAPATPAMSPAPSPPGSPHKGADHR